MRLNNMEIRFAIEEKRLKYDEVARELGVWPSTLSRWLQTEVSPEKKQMILDAIDRIK